MSCTLLRDPPIGSSVKMGILFSQGRHTCISRQRKRHKAIAKRNEIIIMLLQGGKAEMGKVVENCSEGKMWMENPSSEISLAQPDKESAERNLI